MVVEWAKDCVVSQMMACVIIHNLRWRRSYMVLREYHNESMFGESCVSDLTDSQLEMLNLAQLYDVVQMAVDQYYGEDDDGVAREIPEKVLPYPKLLVKWYEDWKQDGKRARNKPKDKDWDSKSSNKKRPVKVKPTTVFVDNEDNAAAFTASRKARESKAKKSKEK